MKQFCALNQWFQTSLGLFVAMEFARVLESADYLHGNTVLQLGNCGDNPWLERIKFNQKWIASPNKVNNSKSIECSLNQLPFSRNSLDCILAPLTLEPFGSSFTLLDEIDRVLKPMGYIIFMSFNPWSLWGGAMKCRLIHCYDDYAIKMRNPFNLNRIFVQRGYTQCTLSNFCYIPPVNNQKLINKFTFFNEVGKMIWPFPSGFYCYIAQKYEYIHPSLITRAFSRPASSYYKSPLQPATIVTIE